jgi:acetyl-CoA synthetase
VTALEDRYQAERDGFAWQVPVVFNIAEACLFRWSRGARRAALVWEDESGATWNLDYQDLAARTLRLASALAERGVRRGDRVAVILAQRPETVVAHMACFALGAICVPLTVQFGADALSSRLGNAQPKAIIFEPVATDALAAALPALFHQPWLIGAAGATGHDVIPWVDALLAGSETFTPISTLATDPALIIYTSGTTGEPKGALMPHSVVLGNLPGFHYSHDEFEHQLRPDALPTRRFWSPADWAWTGGLMDALYPTLYHGQTVVAYRGRFDPATAFGILARHRVTNTFLFPTALKMMMKAVPDPRAQFTLVLETIMSGGEALGTSVYEWARDALGVSINEIFGQTEINYIVGNCQRLWPVKPGSMGRPYPGHNVVILGENGHPVPDGEVGDVAVHRYWTSRADAGSANPVMFLNYWQQPDATQAKFTREWCRTGDLAYRDAEGYLWYQGRADDVFKSAGYRIGPSEIENCLVKHPAVVNAAVVGKPDVERGHVIQAFVVLAPGYAGDEGLIEALQNHVRQFLAPYQYPKEIRFLDALPMTTTGKVQRRLLR